MADTPPRTFRGSIQGFVTLPLSQERAREADHITSVEPQDGAYEENGRQYHGWLKGMYHFPCDEVEMDRMDVCHKLLTVARKDQLLKAPYTKWKSGDRDLPRILDLGCGTGIWLLEMYQVLDKKVYYQGVDLSGIQPPQTFETVVFNWPFDYQAPWALGEDSYDIIHLQMACGSVLNWPELYNKILRHLKPGGWLEQVEIDFEPRCNDDTLRPDAMMRRWYNDLKGATAVVNRHIAYKPQNVGELKAQGFLEVTDESFRLPMNTWPANRELKENGRWHNLFLTLGLEAMSLAPFTRYYKWPVEHVKRYCEDVSAEISNKEIHAYNELHVITARRPYPGEVHS